MKWFYLARYAAGTFLVTIAGVGCGTSPSGSSAVSVPPQTLRMENSYARGSQMKADAASKTLLYVSDPGTNEVQVYAYPPKGSNPLEGTLTGFDQPQGECVDAAGNVWITNTKASTLLKFAHAGSKPIATLDDPGQLPASCAINASTGDLAVVNLMSGSTNGSVSIYKDAQGTPTTYAAGAIVQPLFIGYDNTSHLYVDGLLSDGKPSIAEKRPKNNRFIELGLSVTIGSIGSLQWDGTYLAIGDRTAGNNVIYRFGVGTRKVNLKQTVPIKKACEMMQFFITAINVIVPDASCPSANTYKYPSGGLPVPSKRITEDLVTPFGAAISV